jgi:TetR/AcrR family transcriptional regulator, acrAB operon repressor
MKKTKESAEKTRYELLETGLKIFNEKGYNRTRLEDIANAAGVSRGAIYHHFGNKTELFKEIILSRVNQIVAVFENISAESEEPLKSLKKSLAEILTRIENDSLLTAFAELFAKTEFIEELKELKEQRDYSSWREYKILLNALQTCKSKGLIKNHINLNTFAFTLIGAFDGIFRIWVRNPEMISLKENADQIIEYLFTGVEPA